MPLPIATDDRTDWLLWRREGLGASDAASVAGLSPFGNPWTVWADKRGLVPLDRPEDRSRRAGRLLEPVVIEFFEEDTGIRVVDRQAAVVHPDREWMRATLDGRAAPGGELPTAGVVEVKTSNGLDGQWKDGVPLHILIQAQHQMEVDGAVRAYVAVLLRGDSFLWFEVPRDQAAIDEMLDMEERFWRRHVLAGVPPEVDGSDRTSEAIKAAFARPARETTPLPPQAVGLIADYLRESMAEREAAHRRKQAANKLMALMGDAEIGTLDDRPVVRWPLVQRKGYTVKATEYRKLTVVGGTEDARD